MGSHKVSDVSQIIPSNAGVGEERTSQVLLQEMSREVLGNSTESDKKGKASDKSCQGQNLTDPQIEQIHPRKEFTVERREIQEQRICSRISGHSKSKAKKDGKKDGVQPIGLHPGTPSRGSNEAKSFDQKIGSCASHQRQEGRQPKNKPNRGIEGRSLEVTQTNRGRTVSPSSTIKEDASAMPLLEVLEEVIPPSWRSLFIVSSHDECVKVGQKKVKGDARGPQNGERPSGFYNVGSQKGSDKPCGPLYGNPDGTETMEDWRCAEGYPIKALDEQSGILKSGKMAAGTTRANRNGYTGAMPQTTANDTIGDMGGASRFFYTSKAGSDERWYWCKDCKTAGCLAESIVSPDCAQHGKNPATADLGPLFGGTDTPICSCPPTPRDAHEGHSLEAHPTVKPADLLAWLVRLVTPQGGTVLDPFLGSGTTAVAAMREGFDWIGIEKNPEYVEIAKARISKEQRAVRVLPPR
jgi:hypothetical protein